MYVVAVPVNALCVSKRVSAKHFIWKWCAQEAKKQRRNLSGNDKLYLDRRMDGGRRHLSIGLSGYLIIFIHTSIYYIIICLFNFVS